MKTFKEFIQEDGAVAVNNAGGGNIAGIGVPSSDPKAPSNFAEPPVRKKSKDKYKRANVSGEKAESSVVAKMNTLSSY